MFAMKRNKIDPHALKLAQEWAEQTYPTERWCPRCGIYQQVKQKECDEVCLYVCVVCENPIDESASPF